jgi:hypothetical protein
MDVPPAPARSIDPDEVIPAQSAATPAGATQTPARQPNLLYVRIRLYATQASADATRDILLKHGVSCTVEHAVPGVVVQGYAVMGLDPFVSAGTADYSAYISKIKSALAESGDTRPLSPRLLKWDQPKSPPQPSGPTG